MDSHETLLIFTDTLQRWAFSQASRRHWMRIIQHPLGLAWAFLILFFGSPVWEVCLLLRGWDYCTLLQRLLETPLLIEDQERCIFRAEIVGSQRKKMGSDTQGINIINCLVVSKLSWWHPSWADFCRLYTTRSRCTARDMALTKENILLNIYSMII